ncbi:MAG: NAD(P)H-binding protein [Anaerolineaceae bacterium]|jgi:NADH dehydrogenase|nr:NAD(P)H-binding protein [Anaerolineaceae bacterium]MDD4041944.1 NAD(P)H-binding protein [Anaerolineaceae bacterium]MDD4578129.1 NAD(P)H-binding protein [Anaerolineaceae bacterium]
MPRFFSAIIACMILVTGSTGFIGRKFIEKLEENSLEYRLLLPPGAVSGKLPKGKNYDIVLSSMEDGGNLRAAFNQVDTVFHLAGVEKEGMKADLKQFEIHNLEAFTEIARQAGVKRFYYLSHLGADKNSAYGLLKAKGLGEEVVRKSGLPYTIFRSSILFGEDDHFTQSIARLIRKFIGFFFLPGEGQVLLQPLWVDDFVTSLIWSMDMPGMLNRIIEVGGPEQLSYREIAELVGQAMGRNTKFLNISPVQYSFFTQMVENNMKDPPVNVYWMDYLAENRTTALDSMSRIFEINPARMKLKLTHLKGK